MRRLRRDVNEDLLQADVKSLLEIVYTGSIEATMEEMRRMLILAHSLYISVPVIIIMIMMTVMMTLIDKGDASVAGNATDEEEIHHTV